MPHSLNEAVTTVPLPTQPIHNATASRALEQIILAEADTKMKTASIALMTTRGATVDRSRR
jgi:hypothetical protein